MSTFKDTWDTDLSNLMGAQGQGGDLNTFLQEEQAYDQEVNAYHAAMKRVEQTSDASVAFTMLAWLMANEGFNQLNGQQAIDGGALKIQGDLTKLGNDIEDMTNQSDDATLNSDGTYTYNQTFPDNYLNKVAIRSYYLDNLLSTNTDLRNAIGSDGADALASQYQIIRGQIHDTDPNAGSDVKGATIYFDAVNQDSDPTKNSYMMSYAEFQNDLSTRGDAKQANEASKQKTDAFNENTSTTQSTNAASQEQISNDSNMAKAVQAFVVDMFHAVMDVISAANKATTKGS